MDYYPNADADEGLPDFATAYGTFYDTYAAANSLPFAIAETGTQTSSGGGSATTAQKEQWLKNIINPDDGDLGNYSEYYISATWFEYGPPTKDIDFYVVYGQSAQVVNETISNTENGS